jgi:serine/threonine protein kinase
LGVFLFELTNGCAPFFATNQSRRTRKILKGYEFVDVPPHFSRGLKDLIAKLLENNPSKRLGRTQSGIQAIKKHIFFAGFDWEGEILDMSFIIETFHCFSITIRTSFCQQGSWSARSLLQ